MRFRFGGHSSLRSTARALALAAAVTFSHAHVARAAQSAEPEQSSSHVVSAGTAYDIPLIAAARNRSVRLENVGTEVAPAARLVVNGRDWLTSDAILRGTLHEGMTSEQRVRAIWQFARQNNYHWWPVSDVSNEPSDPVKYFNYYGYGFCSDITAAMGTLFRRAGFPVRLWTLTTAGGHVAPEVYYDGAWHLLDADRDGLYLLRDNRTIAGVADLMADPGLVERAGPAHADLVSMYAANPPGYFFQLAAETQPLAEAPLGVTLRPGEAMSWLWQRLGVYRDDSALEGRVEPPLYANGQLTSTWLASDAEPLRWLAAERNIVTTQGAAGSTYAAGPLVPSAAASFGVEIPYPIVAVGLKAVLSRPSPDDRIDFYLAKSADTVEFQDSEVGSATYRHSQLFAGEFNTATYSDDGGWPMLHTVVSGEPAFVTFRVRPGKPGVPVLIGGGFSRYQEPDLIGLSISLDGYTWQQAWQADVTQIGFFDHLEDVTALVDGAPEFYVRYEFLAVSLIHMEAGWTAGLTSFEMRGVQPELFGPVWTSASDPATGVVRVDVDLTPHVVPARGSSVHEYVVRAEIERAGLEPAGIAELTLTTTVQSAWVALPALATGANHVEYLDDSLGAAQVRVTHTWVETAGVGKPAAPPAAVSPPDGGAADNGGAFALQWEPSADTGGADLFQYHVMICAEASCETPLSSVFDRYLAGRSFGPDELPGTADDGLSPHVDPTWTVDTPDWLSTGRTYYWRVRAQNAAGVWSDFSATWSFTVRRDCRFTVQPAGTVIPAEGGAMRLDIVASDPACTWTSRVVTLQEFVSLSPSSSGVGSGSVSIAFSVNASLVPRNAMAIVAGRAVTIDQAGATCAYSVAASPSLVGAEGAAGTLTVTPNVAECAWSATVAAETGFLRLVGYTGATGSGTVRFLIDANASATARTAAVTVGGTTVTIDQAGVACTYSVTPRTLGFAAGGGVATVSVTAAAADCRWMGLVEQGAEFISVGGAGPFTGTRTLTVSVASQALSAGRAGSLSIAGATIAVAQSGVTCAFAVAPAGSSIGSAAASGAIAVTATAADCAWTASVTSGSPFTAIDAHAGTGRGTIRYSVQENRTPWTREATISVGGQLFAITQARPITYSDTATVDASPANGVTVTMPTGDVRVTFERVTASGVLRVSTLGITPEAEGSVPVGTRFFSSTIFELGAEGGLAFTVADVCLPFVEPEVAAAGLVPTALRLFQLEPVGRWAEIGSRLDAASGTVCGRVSQFSGLALGGPATVTQYFAEGATGAFFDVRLALFNPTDRDGTATLRFLPEAGMPVEQVVALPAHQRLTVDPEQLPELASTAFATTVTADVSFAVDRRMTWDARGYGGHAETGIAAPRVDWYLAEGATHSGFQLFYLLQNPGDAAAEVEVTYLLPAPAAPIVKTYSVQPQHRFSVWVNHEDQRLAATDVSGVIHVTNGQPVVVERAMYLDHGGNRFEAGHGSAAIAAPDTSWFLAEGATGTYFDLFLLFANPSGDPATLQVTYLLPDGSTLRKLYTVAARSRRTVWVDVEEFPDRPGQLPLADTAVSALVESTNGVPVLVERTMWWPGPAPERWREAHNAAGATNTGTRWALADGEVGGAAGTDTFILVANTAPTATEVRATLAFEDGTRVQRDFPVSPNSRFNIAVRSEFPEALDRRFSVVVESLGNAPAGLVVEEAIYWDANGVHWAAGTVSLGTRLR